MLLDLANFSAHPMRMNRARDTLGAVGIILAACLSTGFAASPPVDPSGYWSTKDNESIVRISPCTKPASFCGTVVWLKEPLEKGAPKKDDNNPDKTKRSRPILGLEILSDLEADEDHWKGKAYNADDGKVYDITFKVLPDKAKGDTGEITGCVLRFLCKSETFTKVQTVPGGDPTLPAPAAAATAAPHAGTAASPGKAVPPPVTSHAH